ncbi:unnamed protein product [Lampetra planeri]
MGPTLQRHPFSGLVDSAAGEAGRRCAARSKARADPTSAGDESGLHLHCAAGFRRSPGLAHVLDSLVRVSRRVGWVADPHRGPRAPAVGGTPAAERRAVVGDALGTVRTGLRTRRGAGHPSPATAAGDAFPRTPPKSGAGAVAVSLPRSQGGRTPSHQGPVGGTKPPARRPHGDPGRPKNRSRRTTSAEEVRRAPAGSTEHRGPLGAHARRERRGAWPR